jgi:hypothetical protein
MRVSTCGTNACPDTYNTGIGPLLLDAICPKFLQFYGIGMGTRGVLGHAVVTYRARKYHDPYKFPYTGHGILKLWDM